MLYWRRVLAVVRGCQAPKRISAEPRGARKRARLGYTERSCTSGLYSGSGLRPMFPPSKAYGTLRDAQSATSYSSSRLRELFEKFGEGMLRFLSDESQSGRRIRS